MLITSCRFYRAIPFRASNLPQAASTTKIKLSTLQVIKASSRKQSLSRSSCKLITLVKNVDNLSLFNLSQTLKSSTSKSRSTTMDTNSNLNPQPNSYPSILLNHSILTSHKSWLCQTLTSKEASKGAFMSIQWNNSSSFRLRQNHPRMKRTWSLVKA